MKPALPRFSLTPVVELPLQAKADFWWPLPPWPARIALSARCSDDEVGLVLLQLAQYNADAPENLLLPVQLSDTEDDLIVPGGLLVRSGPREIWPSCCCGLEHWPEWESLLAGGKSPWLGHAPSPWVERSGDAYTLWPDGDLQQGLRDGEPIVFDGEELAAQLGEVRTALDGFVVRIAEVAAKHGPWSTALAQRFARAFVPLRQPCGGVAAP